MSGLQRLKSKHSAANSATCAVPNQTKKTTEFFRWSTPESSSKRTDKTCSPRCVTTAAPPASLRSLTGSFPGLYNARRDNLEKFWSEQFGTHHAILVVESFYENVKRHSMEHRELGPSEHEENVVLQFKPEPAQTMYIACLWSHWTDPKEPDLKGFAAITDEPPEDISAAGHDRCIINLKPEHVDAWLTPESRPRQELQAILSDRAIPVFRHEVEKAA